MALQKDTIVLPLLEFTRSGVHEERPFDVRAERQFEYR